MTSWTAKRVPDIDRTPIFGKKTVNGVTQWWAPYDADTSYMHQRHYASGVSPDFKRKKRSDLPVNAFYAYTGVVKDSYGWVKDAPAYGSNTYEGASRQVGSWCHQALLANYNSFSVSTVGTAAATAAEQRALKLMSNMKFNAAQAFAERRQTADLLVKSVNRFITVVQAFKRGRFASVNRVLKSRGYPPLHPVARKRQDETFGPLVRNPEVGDLLRSPNKNTMGQLWLEYSYGWRPLLNDIYGAAELLAQVHTQTRPHRAVGVASGDWTHRNINSSDGVTAIAQGDATAKSRCVIMFDVSNSLLDSLKSTGISNPALLAWELLPYSFVVDWFIPVGDYLKRLNATSGLTFIKGATSTLTRYKAKAAASSTNQRWLTSGLPCDYTFVQMQRKVLSNFPGATPPGLSLGLNLSQVASGLALLQQIFNRK